MLLYPSPAELGHSFLEAHQAHRGGQGWEEILAASGMRGGRGGWGRVGQWVWCVS